MKRVFLAIPLHDFPELEDHYAGVREALSGEPVKWVEPSNLHLTLHFFGDLEEDAITRAHRLLEQFLSPLSPFSLTFRDLGVFPSVKRPRVLWFGVENSPHLNELAEKVEEVLVEGDFALPDKPFSPHLTLGRFKGLREVQDLEDLLRRYRGRDVGTVRVDAVLLLESILRREGPEYRMLYRYGLKG